MKTKELTEKQGITLISLVVTIIVILIVAGISVVTLTGQNGIINKASSTKENKEKEETKTKIDLAVTSALYDGLEDDEIDLNTLNDELVKDSITIVKKETQNALPWIVEENGKKFKIKPDGTVIEKVSVKILDKDGVEHLVAEEDVKDWYGKAVINYKDNATYRIFYIDFDGDFGDIGTIYLKADGTGNDTKLSEKGAYTYEPKDKKILEIMNRVWAKERLNEVWNENEHVAAYLLDPTTEDITSNRTWVDYFKEGVANYAIGSPSLEMYIKSYNHTHDKDLYGNEPLGFRYQLNETQGYGYKLYGVFQNDGFYTNNIALDYTGFSKMYCDKESESNIWISSPHSYGIYCMCIIDGKKAALTGKGGGNTFELCPVISLKSTFTPQITED